MTPTTMKPCKDCVAEGRDTTRPAIWPGPRCTTHHRKIAKQRKIQNHRRRVENVYGITGEQYDALYEAQGGVCGICRVANGTTKKLAVDHDHQTGEVRGLLCGPCNLMIGRLRVQGMVRALEYIHAPPARRVLT